MLLPGAYFFIVVAIGIMSGLVCFAGGAIGAIFAAWIPFELIQKTKGYKKCASGAKNADHWWFSSLNLARVGFWSGFVITAYSIAGPVSTLIDWIGG